MSDNSRMRQDMEVKVWICVLAISLVTFTSAQPTTPNANEVNETELVTTSSTTTKITTPSKPAVVTNKQGVIIGTVPPPTTAPAPQKQYVSTCQQITIQCSEKDWTVYVDMVYSGRKKDTTCNRNKAGCCTATRDSNQECIRENVVLLDIQRNQCLAKPGEPCLIFEHSSHYIGCDSDLLSQFTMIEFHCIYVPIPTRNDTDLITESTEKVTDKTTSTKQTTESTDKTTSALEVVTPKPLPIAIIAGSAGGGVCLIVIIVIIVLCTRRRKQRIMKQDMTKPELGVTPVSEIGVNYMEDEEVSQDPDIIKTANHFV